MAKHRDDQDHSNRSTPIEDMPTLLDIAREVEAEREQLGHSDVDGARLAPHQAEAQAARTSSDVGAPLEGEDVDETGLGDPDEPRTMRRPDDIRHAGTVPLQPPGSGAMSP